MFGQENRHHLFTVGKTLLPVLVVQVSFNVFFLAVFVLFDDEFLEWVLQDAAENPFLQDLEVGQRSLLQEESEEVTDRGVRTADHQAVDDVEERATFFVSGVHCQPLQVVHDADTVLEVEPNFLQC